MCRGHPARPGSSRPGQRPRGQGRRLQGQRSCVGQAGTQVGTSAGRVHTPGACVHPSPWPCGRALPALPQPGPGGTYLTSLSRPHLLELLRRAEPLMLLAAARGPATWPDPSPGDAAAPSSKAAGLCLLPSPCSSSCHLDPSRPSPLLSSSCPLLRSLVPVPRSKPSLRPAGRLGSLTSTPPPRLRALSPRLWPASVHPGPSRPGGPPG